MTAAAVHLLDLLRGVGVTLTLRDGKIRAVGQTSRLTSAHAARVREHAADISKVLRLPVVLIDDEWLARRRDVTGSVDAQPTVEAPPSNAVSGAESPVSDAARRAPRTVHVASITRPPRYRCTPCAGADRVCCACDSRKPPEGPLGHSWDVHLVRDELVLTCSPKCRGVRGFAERKTAMHANNRREN